MRVGIYTRLSQVRPDEQTHFATATERQAEDVETYVKRAGWTVVRRWTDRGKSGWTGRDRHDFNAMIAAIEKREIDVLAVWKFDRLTRNLKDYARFYEAATMHGVALIGVADGVDTRQLAGQLHADISFAVARNESATISARVRATTGRRARAGRPNGGIRPFGYTNDRLDVVPKEAELVREAFARFIAGEGAITISKDFHRRDIVNSGGAPFTPTSMKRLLRNPRYAGLVVHQGSVLDGVEAAWPRIIPADTWQAAQTAMEVRANGGADARHRQRAPRKYLLTGVIECDCGARMVGRPWREKRRYICPPVNDPAVRYERCGSRTIFAEPVEEYVSGIVRGALLSKRVSQIAANTKDHRAQLDQLAQLRQTLVDNEAAYFAGEVQISPAGFEAGRERLMRRIERLEAQLDDSGRAHLLATAPRDRKALDEWWDGLVFDQRVAFVRAVVRSVTILPGRRGAYQVEVATRVKVGLR